MWKLRVLTDSTGKHLLVVDIALYPAHQVFDIFGRGHLGGPLVVFRILPEVLEPVNCQHQLRGCRVSGNRVSWGLSGIILISRLHFRAGLWGAELGYRTIEQVDLIVEVDDYTLNRMFILAILSSNFTGKDGERSHHSQRAIHSGPRPREA
jgi:hypothetical protein